MIFTRAFWVDAFERSVATAAEAALAVVGVDQLSAFEADWKYVAGVAAGGAVAAFLKCVAKSVRPSDSSPRT